MVADGKLKTIRPNIGLSEEALAGLVSLLKRVLADQHVLYMKLRNYHWNVTGANFLPLHELFEAQYTAIAGSIDETAERIRQYGAAAPGTFTELLALASLKEEPEVVPAANVMLENLVADHEQVIRNLREFADEVDDEYDDIAIEDYFTALIQDHQKMAWLLRAHLEG